MTQNEEKNVVLDEEFIQSENLEKLTEKNTPYYRKYFMALLPYMENSFELDKASSSDKRTKEYQEKSKEIGMKMLSLGGFNWAAALLGPAWFAYRNMRKMAIWYMAYLVAMFGLMSYFEPSSYSWNGVSLGGGNKSAYAFTLLFFICSQALVGFLANSIYFRNLNMKVKDDMQLTSTSNYSGVNIVMLLGFFFAEAFLENKIDIVVKAIFRPYGL